MLTLYRRHAVPGKSQPGGCPHRDDRYWRRCNCPVWVEGTVNRVYHRESLKTRSWSEAKDIIAKWEAAPNQSRRHASVDLTEATSRYIRDCVRKNLSTITIENRTKLLERFSTWCSVQSVADVNAKLLREWFEQLQNRKAGTLDQYKTELKLFFRFALKEKWVDADPTEGIPKIIVRQTPTQYVPRGEFSRLLAVIDDPKMKALTLLLRWSGLRITDALKLERGQIIDGLLMIHTTKTSTPVAIPLPMQVIRALDKLPKEGERFFPGPTEPQAAAFRGELRRATKRANLKHTHPHMLRDTFAVEMLLSGATLDLVSKALGHSSVTVTERHYSPFVKARQEQLNATIRKSWEVPGGDDVDWDAPGAELVETTPPRPEK